MALVFEYEYVYQFPNDPQQEYGYGQCIYKVHHFKVKAGGPVGIFLSEEVHIQI
jgi:hypothetical protein